MQLICVEHQQQIKAPQAGGQFPRRVLNMEKVRPLGHVVRVTGRSELPIPLTAQEQVTRNTQHFKMKIFENAFVWVSERNLP